MATEQAVLDIRQSDPERMILAFSGRLDVKTTASVWDEALEAVANINPKALIIDAKNLAYCDGAGIGLLQELRFYQAEHRHGFQLEDLKPQLQKLFDIIAALPSVLEPEPVAEPKKFFARIGYAAVQICDHLHENIVFVGELTYQLVLTVRHPSRLRWRDVWEATEIVGPNALPIVALMGFLIGLILAFQSAIQLRQFGADIFVANLVGVSLVRELGPFITAIIIAGRSASAFAAEIGTMKINEEINALKTMGLEPMAMLALPRVLAAMIMVPILNMFVIFFGILGGGVVMHTLGYSWNLYMRQLESAIWISDFTGGMVKAFVFGLVIAAIGCMHGLRTRTGASAVGDSTTRAVVSGIIMLAVLDGIFSVLYYILGI